MNENNAQRLRRLSPAAPTHTRRPSQAHSRAPPSRGNRPGPLPLRRVSGCLVSPSVTSSPLHTDVTLVRKARVPTACLPRFEIIYHSACLPCLPINLITCGRSGLGASLPPAFVSCRHQFSSLLARKTPPVLSCLAPFSALMDVSGWMDPPASSSAPVARPHPSWIQPAGRVSRAPSQSSGMQCVWFHGQGPHNRRTLLFPASCLQEMPLP